MAKKNVEKEEKKTLTRAQKTEATKSIVKSILAIKPTRHNELIEEVAKTYTERYAGEDTENVNDVKGRVGSVLDIMKKESEVMYDGGTYALKARLPVPPAEEETPTPKKRGRAKKTEEVAPTVAERAQTEEKPEEKELPKKRGRVKKAPAVEEKKEESALEVPVEKAEIKEEIPPKKRGRKPKVAKAEEGAEKETQKSTPVEKAEESAPKSTPISTPVEIAKEEVSPVAEVKEEKKNTELVVKPKAEISKNVVMDMSFLFGERAKVAPKTEKTPATKEEVKAEEEKKISPVQQRQASVEKEEKAATPSQKTVEAERIKDETTEKRKTVKKPQKESAAKREKPLTAEEKLREQFLKRMRTLGGDYFEYYSVYLLERYSMKNGRRLEGLRISGGDHDGGIDGEIELTDRLGFKETIYIQSKNWNPEKGKEENWVVGETLLQQFIGACACRQAKDGKQHVRGIFITTSRFTPEAKRILDAMSDKIVGYDGNDLFEAAKECEFGIVKKNGEWILDEKLLSGTKAFFYML